MLRELIHLDQDLGEGFGGPAPLGQRVAGSRERYGFRDGCFYGKFARLEQADYTRKLVQVVARTQDVEFLVHEDLSLKADRLFRPPDIYDAPGMSHFVHG